MSSITSSTGIGSVLTNDNKSYLDNIMQNAKSNPLKANQEMGRDQFLHILLTQLSNQNPMDPLQDKDFIAQMAQFSSLESMQSLNKNFETMMTDVKALKQTIESGTTGQSDQGKDIKTLIETMKAQHVTLKQISDALANVNTLQLEQLNLLMGQSQATQAAQAYGD